MKHQLPNRARAVLIIPMGFVAAVAIGLCLSGTAAGQDIIQTQLSQYSAEASAQRWSQSAADFRGNLNNGAQTTHVLYLIRNASYRVRGVCDGDCPDLDLCPLDENRKEITCDNKDDFAPELRFVAACTGSYTLRVKMFKCDQAPCGYAVRTFSPM